MWWGYPLGPNGKYSVRGERVYESEREGKREGTSADWGCVANLFFFFLFSLRGAVPAPPGKEKKIFGASRLVPAPKVHRESREKFFFCASRPVHAPKVHGERWEKKCFYASRLVPATKVHRESREFFFFLRFAPRARA